MILSNTYYSHSRLLYSDSRPQYLTVAYTADQYTRATVERQKSSKEVIDKENMIVLRRVELLVVAYFVVEGTVKMS